MQRRHGMSQVWPWILKTRLPVASCSCMQHIIRFVFLQTKRMCHIYTPHTKVNNFIIREHDGILNTLNVLTATVQNYHFIDIHHKFPLMSLNVQTIYTNTVHFNGNFKHFFKGWCSEDTMFYKIIKYPCLYISHLTLHYNEHVSIHVNWLLKIA